MPVNARGLQFHAVHNGVGVVFQNGEALPWATRERLVDQTGVKRYWTVIVPTIPRPS